LLSLGFLENSNKKACTPLSLLQEANAVRKLFTCNLNSKDEQKSFITAITVNTFTFSYNFSLVFLIQHNANISKTVKSKYLILLRLNKITDEVWKYLEEKEATSQGKAKKRTPITLNKLKCADFLALSVNYQVGEI
jgi:hypothetical protein